jgi:UDP-2,3-diacylglucosamine pyrophosphatase LpxH
MRTISKLNSAFYKALPVPFDNTSKLVFFSDVHRGMDNSSDEFGRNKHIYNYAMEYYYHNDFTYVEVGDGDELWENKSFRYIHNAHKETFDIMKKFYADNRMYLLLGNHDMQCSDPAYVRKFYYNIIDEYTGIEESLFPGIEMYESLILKHRKTGQEIFVVHGHQGDFLNDQFWRLSYISVRYLWRHLHRLGVSYTASPAKNRLKRHRIEKNISKWSDKTGIMVICGHTHRPKFPAVKAPAYFNSGCCIHPRGIQCLEIVYDKISLVSWMTSSKKDGTLFIKRKVLKGPMPLVSFSKNALNVDYSQEFNGNMFSDYRIQRKIRKEEQKWENGEDND